MEPVAVAAILSMLLSSAAEHAGSSLGSSISDTWKSLRKKLTDVPNQDEEAQLVLQKSSGELSEQLSPENIEAISEVFQDMANQNPKLSVEIQEELKKLIPKIRDEDPKLAQKLEEKTDQLAAEMVAIGKQIEDVRLQLKDIQVNVGSGDYVGKDPYLLSGNPNLIKISNVYNHQYYNSSYDAEGSGQNTPINNQGNNVGYGQNFGTVNSDSTNVIYNHFFFESGRLLSQIENIKGKVTQYFTAKTGMDALNKIRQPRALGELYVHEANLNLPLLAFGNLSFKMRRKDEKTKEKEEEDSKTNENADYYLNQIRDIEYNLGKDSLEDSRLLRDLGTIAGQLNNKISILNNSFIFALYPASSSKELVENMASKIGYREYREEAEMQLTVIVKLVDKLNHLMRKFDIENLNSASKTTETENRKKDLTDVVSFLISHDKDIEDEALPIILKSLMKQASNKKFQVEDDGTGEDLFGNRLYILSDESQAAVGIMTDIENRKLLVEQLIEKDRSRRNRTASLVTFSIVLVIVVISVGGIFYGPQFTVGDEPLEKLNLPLLNIPWPVVFWSFIGSFAAMIYRFNRQPIYEFGDVIKWTLTRLVQGVVLGSAFYLILVSGLALLTGNSLEADNANTGNRLADEVILVLTFLVGFSDRFADTMFNALIDRYSNIQKKSEDK